MAISWRINKSILHDDNYIKIKWYLIKLLEMVQWFWPIASWLLVLVKKDSLKYDSMLKLVNLFKKAFKSIEKSMESEKIIQWQDLLKKIRQVENNSEWDADLNIGDYY